MNKAENRLGFSTSGFTEVAPTRGTYLEVGIDEACSHEADPMIVDKEERSHALGEAERQHDGDGSKKGREG